MIKVNLAQIPSLAETDVIVAKQNKATLATGEYLASVNAKDLQGKTVLFSRFKGKRVLLNFWASWCDACIEEFAYFNQLQKKYGKKGLQIVMINVDQDKDWPKAEELIAQAGLSPVVWRSSATQSMGQFGYSALPYTVLIDQNSRVVQTYHGSLLGQRQKFEKQLDRFF
jgi:thiol-disulfide isomerase/thioredoxin